MRQLLGLRGHAVKLPQVSTRVCNDHEVDQNLATDFFADFPTELPTMATMVTMLTALKYG